MQRSFSQNNRVVHVWAAVANQIKAYATTGVQLDAYPEGGYDDVTFVFRTITLDADQNPDVIVQVSGNGTWDSTHARNLTGGTTVLTGTTDGDHTVVVEVTAPPEKYVRLLIDPKNASGDVVAISDVFAILSYGRSNPVEYTDSNPDHKVIKTHIVAPVKEATAFTDVDA
jgi:hypothetical protein